MPAFSANKGKGKRQNYAHWHEVCRKALKQNTRRAILKSWLIGYQQFVEVKGTAEQVHLSVLVKAG